MYSFAGGCCGKPRQLAPHDRRGAVAVLVAIALTALVGMVAIGIDFGMVAMAAQRVQNVADAAALAGATGYTASDQAGALTRIGDTVTANNQLGSQITWQGGEVVFYDAGSTVPGWGLLDSQSAAIKVVAHLPVRYSFAPIMGLQGTTVTRTATALRVQGNGSLACIFAHGTPASTYHDITYNGAKQIFHHADIWSNADITMNGSGQNIQAAAHADRDFRINGSNQTITKPAEYVRNWSINGSNQDVNPVQVPSNPKPYPLDYTEDDFTYDYDVSSYTVNGSNKTVPPGVYRVHGDVTINGSGCNLTGVTFVADGDITLNGSNHGPATPAAPNYMLFYSLDGNITVNGAKGQWAGTMWAPHGTLTYNGSNQSVQNGSLLAERITVNGSGWEIFGSPDPSGGTESVTLIQ